MCAQQWNCEAHLAQRTSVRIAAVAAAAEVVVVIVVVAAAAAAAAAAAVVAVVLTLPHILRAERKRKPVEVTCI